MAYDFSETRSKLTAALDHLTKDIASLRTGRASVQLLDPVMVEAYGTRMRLVEVANVSAPDPSLITVSPWDKGLLAPVEKAIASAGLNLNPVVDGQIIRIAIPPLTEETRREMVKKLHQKIESGRVMLRTIRTDAKQDIEGQEGDGGVSEDDITRDLEALEKLLKDFMEKLDALAAAKEKELLTI